MNHILPPRPFLDAIVIRVLILWLFLHAAAGYGATMITETPFPQSLIPTLVGAPFLFAVVILAMRLEMARRSELIFLANLGHSFRKIALVMVAECLVLEVGLVVALG